jgi:hypothetical protein
MKSPVSLCVWVAGALFVGSDAQALERLFTTELQRYQLDHPNDQKTQTQPQPADRIERVLFNGFVKSRQGRNTFWINGNMDEKPKLGIKALGLSAGRVVVDAQGRRVVLKPGQMADMNHHQVREVFDLPANAQTNAEETPVANQSVPSVDGPEDAP